MAYTLGEAAKATGKSKATISKAVKTGRLSAVRKETGAFSIEAAELHRVYPLNVQNEQVRTPEDPSEKPGNSSAILEMEARLEAARERLTDKEVVIADLREDRDRWRQQATALLTDRRHSGFWKRLLG